MTKRIIPLFLLLTLPSLVAHQDTNIRLLGYTFYGLPDSYQPATFVLEKKRIRIGTNAVTIPDYLWKRLVRSEKNRIDFRSSWYHNLERIPPYFVISAKESNTEDSFNLTLNLDTLEVLLFEKETRTSDPSGTEVDYEQIAIQKPCLDSWIIEKH